MKNLFKNLMLVAVAAMAFTACTETGEEVNAVTKKVVLEFVADLADDDTRVAFGEKDGNKYPTVWEASDNVTVKVGDKTTSYTLTEEDVLESGKKAIIRPEFELVGDETLSGDIVATVNEYVYFDNHQGNKPTISLKAEAVYPATNLVFEHQYAYGKMELVGLPAEFNVTEVKLNLVGGGNTLNHTINGYSVEDNIFWFTTEAMEAVESFSVYASNGAETYYKEVTVEKAFAFVVGQVSAFRVKELIVKPADFNVQLTKITSMSNNVIRFQGDNAEDNITISFNPGLENIVAGHYVAVDKDWVNGGVWAWSSDSALEVKNEFQGSSVDVNAAGGGQWYYNHNGVDVTVDGDVYTIVAHLQNYTSAGNQTVDFTYVGKLEAPEPEPEPEGLVFTSAKWVNTSYSDKLVQFYTADGATLQLNWYNCGSDAWIVPNTYGFASSGAIYYGGQYSWYENTAAGIDAEISNGTVVVSVVGGKYYIEFTNLADWDGNVYIESATFTGEITGLQVPDMRTQLAAPSNATGSADGKTITLSWDPVEGADGYRVKLYSPHEEYFEEIVTTNEYVYEAQLYSKQYLFTIMSYASDTNAQYRSSEDAYANVTTGKDPSIWADVVANNIIWDSANGAFKMTGEVVSGTAWGHSGDYIRLFINESDRPGNNSIKVGTYTGCGGTSPQAGQFGAKLYLYWGTTTYESAFGSTSTVEVSYDEAVGYTIVLTHNNVTYGYKGMPEGWVAPSEGGDEPVNPDPEQGNELGSESNPYTFASVASNNFFLNFEGAENGASLQLDRQNSDVNVMADYDGPFALNYTAIIYAGSGCIYTVGGNVYYYASFAPYSTLEVTKADGNWTCKLKMSVDGGATFTYYTYTGQIANQAY